MLHRIRKLRAVEAGFTLIELLIVVVILGVLAGTVVFAVGKFNGDGVQAACRSDVKNVEIASEAFYAKSNPQAYAADIKALVDGGYLKEEPNSNSYTVNYDNTVTPPTISGTYSGGTC